MVEEVGFEDASACEVEGWLAKQALALSMCLPVYKLCCSDSLYEVRSAGAYAVGRPDTFATLQRVLVLGPHVNELFEPKHV